MKLLEKLVRTKGGILNEELLKYFKRFGASSSVLPDAEKQYLENKFGKLYISNDDYYRAIEKYIETIPLEVSDILKKYGSDAHLYLPGVGTFTGFTTGNYVESTGNTSTILDDVTGLVLDAAGSVGPEISANNDFTGWSGGTGWTFSGGKARANAATGNASRLATVTADKTYKVVIRCDSYTSGGYKVLYEGGQSLFGDKTSVGQFEATLRANATGQIYIWVNSALTATFDYISVREVTGTHATQATTANKPILRRGIVNLLTYSNDLTNAAWSANSGAAKVNATTFSLTNTHASYIANALYGVTIGNTYTAAIILSGTPGTQVYLGICDLGGDYPRTNQAITLSATPTLYTVTRPSVTQTGIDVRVTDSATSATITLRGAAIFQGVLTAKQIIAAGGIPLTTTASASSQYGPYAWQFDGSNDSLALPGPLFQMADDHCIVAAASKNSVDTNSPGVFAVEGGTTELIGLTFSSAKVQYFLNAGGTATYRVSNADYQSIPTVISGRKIGSTALLRVNGVQQGATLSTSAVGSNAMTGASIGKHTYAGVAAPMNGLIYPVIAIKGTVSDSDLLVLEKWLGSIAGVVI